MIDRAVLPWGWACVAGHIDEGETPEQAITREVKEEVGLDVKKHKLLLHEFVEWNYCSKGVCGHDCYLFEIPQWSGKVKISKREVKEFAWLAPKEISKLELEKVWKYWFDKLKIIE